MKLKGLMEVQSRLLHIDKRLLFRPRISQLFFGINNHTIWFFYWLNSKSKELRFFWVEVV